MKEALYTLTTNCIESGRLRLTASLRNLFADVEEVKAKAPGGLELYLRPNFEEGVLEGLGPFLQSGEVAANDQLRFVLEGDEVSVEVVGRRPRARSRVVSPPVEKPKKEEKPKVTPYPKEVMYPSEAKRPGYVESLVALGLEAFPEGRLWRLRARLGRKGFSAVLAKAGAVTPDDLRRAKAEKGVDYAVLVVDAERPSPEPGLVVASEAALRDLAELNKSFPLGAFEILKLFDGGRIGRDEVEAQRRQVAGLLGERAQFSAVLLALARFRPDQVFYLEDVVEELSGGASPEVVGRVLEILAGPPFFAVEPLDRGEYRLREDVESLLSGLMAYAEQLRRRLPVLA